MPLINQKATGFAVVFAKSLPALIFPSRLPDQGVIGIGRIVLET